MLRLLRQSIFLLLVPLVLCQCTNSPFSFGKSSRTSELRRTGYSAVPLQKLSGDVRFSGVFQVNGEPLRFLIDSGANSTDVDGDLAKRVGLLRDRKVKVVTRGALGREVSSGRGYGTLQIGPMYSRSFPFTIAPSTGRRTSTSSYAGQIGLDALSGIGALVDIPGARLWVPEAPVNGSFQSINRGPRNGLGSKILALEKAGTLPHLLLRGTLDGRSVTWVVDTGAEISVMAAESFDRFNLPSRNTNSRMIDASGDRIALRHARLRDVNFGNVNIAVFDIAIAPLGTVREFFRDVNGRPIDGILGMDFLSKGEALLDTGSRLIYLGKP